MLASSAQRQYDPQEVLQRLHTELTGGACSSECVLEARLLPMIRWCAQATRHWAETQGIPIPPASVSEVLTVYDLQVNLCEW